MSEKVSGLPVLGYQDQLSSAVTLVNGNKMIEEKVLRIIDYHQQLPAVVTDKRMVALARTYIELGFMCLNRSVFQPKRLTDEQLQEMQEKE